MGTLIINKWDFRAQPFVLTAVVSLLFVIVWLYQSTPRHRAARLAVRSLGTALALAGVWLAARLGSSLIASHQSLTAQTFHPWQEEAQRVRDGACQQPEARLALYPGGGSIYTYFFSGMKPVSRYVFMWPWVADFGLEEVIEALSQEETLALVVRQEAIIWERYDTRVYLRPLDEFLQAHYIRIGEGVYRSPALEALCSARAR